MTIQSDLLHGFCSSYLYKQLNCRKTQFLNCDVIDGHHGQIQKKKVQKVNSRPLPVKLEKPREDKVQLLLNQKTTAAIILRATPQQPASAVSLPASHSLSICLDLHHSPPPPFLPLVCHTHNLALSDRNIKHSRQQSGSQNSEFAELGVAF